MNNQKESFIEDQLNEDIEENGNDKNGKNKMVSIDSHQKCLQVNLIHSNESSYILVDANEKLDRGDKVIIDSIYGKDMADVLGEVLSLKSVPEKMISNVIRIATKEDLAHHKQNCAKEKAAMQTCQELIEKHHLEMKLICAHYLIDEPKILFFFTSENRVDFRELVKDLVAVFKVRIELRQIGVRDESRMLGGLSICGKDYCCHAITDHLNPVSIKMAKEQNLSLNSMKISGTCGRLLCCLSYEYNFYKEERKYFPTIGTFVQVDSEKAKVSELNIITRMVKLEGEEGNVIQAPLKFLKYNNMKKRWFLQKFDREKEMEQRSMRHQDVLANLETMDKNEVLQAQLKCCTHLQTSEVKENPRSLNRENHEKKEPQTKRNFFHNHKTPSSKS